MNVLLIKPGNLSDHIQPSLGLGYLASQIRSDHEVKIVDFIKEKLTVDQILPLLEEFKPDVVGSQCFSMDLPIVKSLLQTIKHLDRDIVTIVGGVHPTTSPQHTMDFFGKSILDFVFVGEGEVGFPRFLKELEASSSPDFQNVPGLGWNINGKLLVNPRAAVQDLDSLGMPAWDLIMPETYPFSPHGIVCKNFPIAPVMATRGCTYKCTFCTSAGTPLRKRSVGVLIKEVALLYHNHGIREFHMVDDNFTLDMDYAKEFSREIIKKNLKISLATPNGVRLDKLDKELLEYMKEAGFYSIAVGIESGSKRIRAKMRKGSNLNTIRKKLQIVKEVKGIDITGFFMIGFPGETRQDIETTLLFSQELPLTRATFSSFIPLPGTEMWRELEANGELDRVDEKRYVFWARGYVPQGMTRRELTYLHRKAFLMFYLRPKIILLNLKWMIHPRIMLYALRYLWRRIKP